MQLVVLVAILKGWGCIDFHYASSVAVGTTDRCRHILYVFFFFFIIVVRNLGYCFGSL